MREPNQAPAPASRASMMQDAAANDDVFRTAQVVDAGWWLSLWAAYPAGPAWQLRRPAADAAGWVDFHGGHDRPLRLDEDDATALAAALNRHVASMQARLGST